MQDSFRIGEVAIFHRPGSRYNGVEVCVTEALHLSSVFDFRDGITRLELVYGIESPHFPPLRPGRDGHCARPDELRKKRPPQDWAKLCNLDEAPVETRELEIA